jgi:hypothetical protein
MGAIPCPRLVGFKLIGELLIPTVGDTNNDDVRTDGVQTEATDSTVTGTSVIQNMSVGTDALDHIANNCCNHQHTSSD